MSDSARPHRRQPTRLPRPWDSPDKNTGVGCHFLLQCVKVKLLSRVRLLATPGTAAHQAPPSVGFSRQEYWSGVPLPSPVSVLGLLIMNYRRLGAYSSRNLFSHGSESPKSEVQVSAGLVHSGASEESLFRASVPAIPGGPRGFGSITLLPHSHATFSVSVDPGPHSSSPQKDTSSWVRAHPPPV